jgi:hypothetical protein
MRFVSLTASCESGTRHRACTPSPIRSKIQPMKLQLQAHGLRVRADESEFATLLEVGLVRADFALPGLPLHLLVEATDGAGMRFDAAAGSLHLRLPRVALDDYRSRLPCRDGLVADQAGFEISFEVDVRDSVRVRGPRRRSER